MTYPYSIYEEATGRIVSTCQAATRDQIPREGPIAESGGLAVIHERSDPTRQCVRGMRVVDKPAEELEEIDRRARRFDVNKRRNKVLAKPLRYAGHRFDMDPESRLRLLFAWQEASTAISVGAQRGDLKWHGGPEPFVWITADNEEVPLDAWQVVALARAVQERDRRIVFQARQMKVAPSPSMNVRMSDLWASEEELQA
ncbi:MAG: DUF4376 domain-containing protein [Pseudomonadota bacterium]